MTTLHASLLPTSSESFLEALPAVALPITEGAAAETLAPEPGIIRAMAQWQQTLVSPENTIRQVLRVIDNAELQVALVTDPQDKLLGVITDGDVRRGLLRGQSLESPALSIMNTEFIAASPDMFLTAVEALMREKQLRHMPILDADGRILDLVLLDETTKTQRLDNLVVLMAGGLGERLGELTRETPKSLLKIGEKPILEIILESFLAQGFYRFCMSINYKADMIENHFGDGSRWGAEIRYVRESKRLGTGGSLSLLPEVPKEPFFVMNGDLLTKVNFKGMLEFHKAQAQLATMAVREYDVQIPFGVTELQGTTITGIVEKPIKRFFVNAGVYVLSPQCLPIIPQDTFFDMPNLFQKLMQGGFTTSSFPLHEYWLDIGQMGDFQRAGLDYLEHWITKK
ncbi:MAG: nucleotidyltransferase family protein [Trueperaceae bacterium]